MIFSRASLVLALSLVLSVSARPFGKRWGPWGDSWGGGSWSPGSWGGDDEQHHSWTPTPTSSYPWDLLKRHGEYKAAHCDLQNAIQYMNLTAVSPALPAPNHKLFQITVGRGTQNYTCDLANATATPVPIGALASLYDVSCMVLKAKPLFDTMPIWSLNSPPVAINDVDEYINKHYLSGHHYFLDDTTPFFNLDTEHNQYGMGAMAKANASDAPSTAYAGATAGAVQWLKLNANPTDEGSWKEVYRLNTAGGNPPETCDGMSATFEVQYAAEYWIFK